MSCAPGEETHPLLLTLVIFHLLPDFLLTSFLNLFLPIYLLSFKYFLALFLFDDRDQLSVSLST